LRNFTSERIKEIFILSEPERLKFLNHQSKKEDISIENLTGIIVGKVLLSDKIFKEWGIEEEEL